MDLGLNLHQRDQEKTAIEKEKQKAEYTAMIQECKRSKGIVDDGATEIAQTVELAKVDGRDAHTLVGNERLAWLCMRNLAWSEARARRVVFEYVRYMKLKYTSTLDDKNGLRGCPSPDVEQCLRQAILDTGNYRHHPHPYDEIEQLRLIDTRSARYRLTLAFYELTFKAAPPATVWPPDAYAEPPTTEPARHEFIVVRCVNAEECMIKCSLDEDTVRYLIERVSATAGYWTLGMYLSFCGQDISNRGDAKLRDVCMVNGAVVNVCRR